MDEKRKLVLDDQFDVFSMLAGGNYVCIYDAKSAVTRYSPGAVDIFGLPGEYIEDGAYSWSENVHPEDNIRYIETMVAMQSGKTRTYDLTYRVRKKDGDYSLFRQVGGVLRDEDGTPSMMGGMMVNEGLMEYTDPVTILRNKTGFFEDLGLKMHAKQKCSVLLIGINKLSQINQTAGYSFGNRILQQVGWQIQERIGTRGITYRMDGSRFAVIMNGSMHEEAESLYEGVREKLMEGIRIGGVSTKLFTSGALILANGRTMREQAVYSCLDFAFRESRERKRGELVIFDRRAEQDEGQSFAIIDEIRSSILDQCRGFYLAYQPVMRGDEKRPVGVEALLRWKSDDFGEVEPMRFIPYLESDSAFLRLSRWIIETAMSDGLALVERIPDFTIGVNISPQQLEREDFAEEVIEAAARIGFPLTNLSLELSKECRLLDFDSVRSTVGELRAAGVSIVIDDYGSGMDSLRFSKEIRADVIKLDRSLIKDIEDSEEDRVMALHLSELVAVFGAAVCVKGVETEKMREILSTFPIRSMQGFLFTPPVSSSNLLAMFE